LQIISWAVAANYGCVGFCEVGELSAVFATSVFCDWFLFLAAFLHKYPGHHQWNEHHYESATEKNDGVQRPFDFVVSVEAPDFDHGKTKRAKGRGPILSARQFFKEVYEPLHEEIS
jgi:hypothetical protein